MVFKENCMSDTIQVLSDATFSDSLTDSPTVVDFWAGWCGPCKALAPIFEELSLEMKGKLKFAKINVDDNNETASKYNIRSIPCLIVFKDKKEVGRVLGQKEKTELRADLEKFL
jgi:thioredoxin 1